MKFPSPFGDLVIYIRSKLRQLGSLHSVSVPFRGSGYLYRTGGQGMVQQLRFPSPFGDLVIYISSTRENPITLKFPSPFGDLVIYIQIRCWIQMIDCFRPLSGIWLSISYKGSFYKHGKKRFRPLAGFWLSILYRENG